MVSQEEKREILKRALGQFLKYFLSGKYGWPNINLNALAEKAIVIECEVEHYEDHAVIYDEDRAIFEFLDFPLPPGKAYAIIVPDPGEL